MTTTNKSTAAQIKAEAMAISKEERAVADKAKQAKVLALRAKTGLMYSTSVEKGMFRLEILDFSGKRVVVTPACEFMPFYQFNEFFRSFEA